VRFRLLPAIFAVLLAPGCVIVQVGVTNPIPGLSTVAVAPFLNLSPERAVDGRRFALAYATELQKVPGFEVLPVGVTEIAMIDGKIDLNDVDDVLKLAKILRVDAVVVGAVTEYSPYYPPRVGMQVSWYSPKAWAFYPGIQTETAARAQLKDWDKKRLQEWRDYHKQLDDETAPETPVWERAYRCFKRWPVIRNIYGEPCLAERDRPTGMIWRAQSPSLGTQGLSQKPPDEPVSAVSTREAPVPAPVELTSAASPNQEADSDDGPRPVKVAHYQELEGMPAVVRQMTADDRSGTSGMQPPALLGSPNGAVPLPPVPDDEANSRNATRAPDSGEPPPLPGGPGVPSSSQRGNSSKTLPPVPPAPSVFDQLPPGMDLAPLTPHTSPRAIPEQPPLVDDEVPKVQPVRNPALAPPGPQPNPYNVPQPIQPWQVDPHLPIMAYTRLFDGADGDLVAALRDYVELGGDLRSGGWEAYLHRSDDFVRFTSYRMILEMLSLHGGEGKHRMIFKFRKYK